MANSTKVTFTLDKATIARLNDAAERLAIPKSEVVREAIQDYHLRIGKLGETERRRMLADFDRLVPRIPDRPAAEVQRELDEIRKARRRGGRAGGARQRP
jgi:predicted transcriptional regulator